MSEELSSKKCIPCEGGIPAFNEEQINNFLKKIDNWSAEKDEEGKFYLIKEFEFKNFLGSQDFVNKVGDLAEKEGHHPDLYYGWGYAKVKIYTHAIGGLAESDFILAAKIDKIN